MEVHAHSHTERKKWRHYLWEFFMLFMAVTLGFFVENQREGYVERHKGLQYLRSFVEDLEQDTIHFSDLVDTYKEKATVVDNLFECYDTVTGKLHSTDCLISIINQSSGFPDFVYTDRTLQQLKNSGGLRLLNTSDADSITVYDNAVRAQQINETTEVQETQTLLRSVSYELINFPSIREIIKINDLSNELKSGRIPFLFGNNTVLLNKYFNILFHYKGVLHSQVFFIQRLKDRAISLIAYFKKEHHLK